MEADGIGYFWQAASCPTISLDKTAWSIVVNPVRDPFTVLLFLNLITFISPCHLFSSFWHPFFSNDVPNGSTTSQENVNRLSNKTAALSLSEDTEGGGGDQEAQRTGATPTSAPWRNKRSFPFSQGSFFPPIWDDGRHRVRTVLAAGPGTMCATPLLETNPAHSSH